MLLPGLLQTLSLHLVVAHGRVSLTQKLILCVEFFELLAERVVLLLQVDRLQHTHISDLLQGHRMHEEAWSIGLAQGLRPRLDAPDEVKLAGLSVLGDGTTSLLFHHNQWLTELIHEIIHLAAKFDPDRLRLVTLHFLFAVEFALIDIADELTGLVAHGVLETFGDEINVTITELFDIVGHLLS